MGSEELAAVKVVASSVKGELLVIAVDASGESVLSDLGIKQSESQESWLPPLSPHQ